MGEEKLDYVLDLSPESQWITVTTGGHTKQNFLYVQEVGDFYALPAYYTAREGLASYLIKYVVDGRGVCRYGEQSHLLEPGSVMWLDCEKPMYYATAPGADHWHVLWVHFFGANSRQYYEQFLAMNKNQNVCRLKAGHNVECNLRALLDLYGHGENSVRDDFLAMALLTNILAECVAFSIGDSRRETDVPDVIRMAQQYLRENITGRVTLGDLSTRYSLDKFYFQKLFKRFVGMSPAEYLLLLRLNRAKELLRTTNYTVSRIAEDVGLPNLSYFYCVFRRHEGRTPSEYRRVWYGQGGLESPV